ncbi:MAG: type IV pilus modification PilV family protein [Planctomycetota bacterium]
MSAKSRRAAQAGFTVLEAAIALTVLAVALLSLWGTLLYCSRSNQVAEQKVRALNAAQAKLEEKKSSSFESLITDYGPSGSFGDQFPVPSLDDDEEVARGQIVFYVSETATPDGGAVGLPLDLNGDGDAEDEDVSASYGILPVRVSIMWTGALGPQRMDVRAILKQEE